MKVCQKLVRSFGAGARDETQAGVQDAELGSELADLVGISSNSKLAWASKTRQDKQDLLQAIQMIETLVPQIATQLDVAAASGSHASEWVKARRADMQHLRATLSTMASQNENMAKAAVTAAAVARLAKNGGLESDITALSQRLHAVYESVGRSVNGIARDMQDRGIVDATASSSATGSAQEVTRRMQEVSDVLVQAEPVVNQGKKLRADVDVALAMLRSAPLVSSR